MITNVTQIVARHKRASQKFRKQIKQDPEKAKAFLIEAGILVKSPSSPNGVKLAKRYESTG